MREILVAFDDDRQVEKIRDTGATFLPRKKGIALKRHWAARKSPFILVQEDGKPVKAFYSETCDVCKELSRYLNPE